MPKTDILTFYQGINIMIETGFFALYYYIYCLFFDNNNIVINILFTTTIFALWILSVTIGTNVSLALNFPESRSLSY